VFSVLLCSAAANWAPLILERCHHSTLLQCKKRYPWINSNFQLFFPLLHDAFAYCCQIQKDLLLHRNLLLPHLFVLVCQTLFMIEHPQALWKCWISQCFPNVFGCFSGILRAKNLQCTALLTLKYVLFWLVTGNWV